MLYDLPADYVYRGNSLSPTYLPEDFEDINIRMLDMLNLTFKDRLIMEGNNQFVRRFRNPLDVVDLTGENKVIIFCFQSKENQLKRRKTEFNATNNSFYIFYCYFNYCTIAH